MKKQYLCGVTNSETEYGKTLATTQSGVTCPRAQC